MRYFIIAGEQSGDLHGSNLVKGLLAADNHAEIQCWGGDLMKSAGAEVLVHYKNLAFMGFTDVLKNIRTISGNFKLCKKQIADFKPDVVILIDYPGFNLRIAKHAKKSGFKTFYYISPKLWAWNEGRVKKVKKYVDRMFIIFPFEVDFYKKHEVEAAYYGNPLIDETEKRLSQFQGKEKISESLDLGKKPVIAILAGSRRKEIELILPRMLRVTDHFPDYQFVLAGVKNIPDELYLKIIGDKPIRLIKEKTYEILYIAEAGLVTSGTATLEAALHNMPQVVCYFGDFFSMLIGWMVIRVKHISLVNLIMNSEVVKELVQYDLTEEAIRVELQEILKGGGKREKMLNDYAELRKLLGSPGASARVAEEMFRELSVK